MIKDTFEQYISTIITNDYVVKEAMNYSYLADSKRLRPLLLMSMLIDMGYDEKEGLEAASALEMIHTYSLIHDDLPAFDNDDYRRGKLTCHKMFNESTAVLAGDGLLTEAFHHLATSHYSAEVKVKLIDILSSHAGADGMIRGQSFDMLYETTNPTLQQLKEMNNDKTGKLLTAPFLMALAIASKEELNDTFTKIGRIIGIAFQIQDDILDVTSTQEMMGKSLSDCDNDKSTYVTLMGLSEAQQVVEEMYQEVDCLLPEQFVTTSQLLKSMRKRVK